MNKALTQNPSKQPFHYSNGKVVEVSMSVAGGNNRYVRIFDLPPEVSDQDISLVLKEYGKVQRVEREKFPADLGLGDLFTGVRGIHMDIAKDIPSMLVFTKRRGRIFYEQMKMKCFLCQSENHLKAECPENKARRSKAECNWQQRNTYAGAVGGSAISNDNGLEEELEIEVLEEDEEEMDENLTTECSTDSTEKQPTKRQHQQPQLNKQKPLKGASWTENVQLLTKLINTPNLDR